MSSNIETMKNRIKEINEQLDKLIQEVNDLKVQREQVLYELSKIKTPKIRVNQEEIEKLEDILKKLDDEVQTKVLKPDEERRIFERIKETEKRLSMLRSIKSSLDKVQELRNRLDKIKKRLRELHEVIEPLLNEKEKLKNEIQRQIILDKLRKYKAMEKEKKKEKGYNINLKFEKINRNEIKEAIKKKLEKGEPVSIEELKVLYDERQ
ncbi:MAG: hypothetical protein ACP5LF_02545 [Nitrososphaeria archaeon]|nr:hypothetical protein [Conexivisphaerales archaeon]